MLGVITRTVRQIEREPTHKATLFLIIFAQLVCQKVLLTRFVIYYLKKRNVHRDVLCPKKIACGAQNWMFLKVGSGPFAEHTRAPVLQTH